MPLTAREFGQIEIAIRAMDGLTMNNTRYVATSSVLVLLKSYLEGVVATVSEVGSDIITVKYTGPASTLGGGGEHGFSKETGN